MPAMLNTWTIDPDKRERGHRYLGVPSMGAELLNC
jgi:hypothetical protein